MAKNVFIIGPDKYNLSMLELVPHRERYNFHSLLDFEEVKHSGAYDVPGLMAKAEAELDRFDGPVDAIVTTWDFPVSSIMALLRQKYDLPRPSLESVAKCEHKYWSRVEQAKVIPECTPNFAAINPFDTDLLSDIPFDYPFWIKPIKSLRSFLAFKIKNEDDLRNCLPIIREEIPRLAEPFNYFLDRLDLPEDIAGVNGSYCIAEELIKGRQCTIEGYLYEDEVVIYGVIDSLRETDSSSFSSYEYPSSLPDAVQDRMRQAADKIIRQIDYAHVPFNIEFFYDTESDGLKLLEINPRISQSHSDLFYKVDGAPNHQIMVDLALGQRPDFPNGEGEFRHAGKFFIRAHRDGVITRAPSPEDILRIQEKYPGTLIELAIEEGGALSDLPDQDSYSYELGVVFVGADTRDELHRKSEECLKELTFEIEPAEYAETAFKDTTD